MNSMTQVLDYLAWSHTDVAACLAMHVIACEANGVSPDWMEEVVE